MTKKKKSKEIEKVPYKLFEQDEIVYCLFHVIKSRSIFIPLKVKIEAIDLKYIDNPKYTVKVVDVYDKVSFLKTYFLFEPIVHRSILTDLEVVKKSENKAYLNTNLNELSSNSSKDKLIEIFDSPKNYLLIEAMNCFETEEEMFQILDEVQDFVIMDLISELSDLMFRKSYKGLYSISSKSKFLEHNREFFKKGFTDYEWKNFIVAAKRDYNTKFYRKTYF